MAAPEESPLWKNPGWCHVEELSGDVKEEEEEAEATGEDIV